MSSPAAGAEPGPSSHFATLPAVSVKERPGAPKAPSEQTVSPGRVTPRGSETKPGLEYLGQDRTFLPSFPHPHGPCSTLGVTVSPSMITCPTCISHRKLRFPNRS